MKEDLVSVENALLAKEKGFDEECSFVYNTKKEVEELAYYEGYGGLLVNSSVNDTSTGEVYICTIPTQALLAKWLRQKHNIVVNIKHITHNQKYGFSVTGKYNEANGGYLIPYDFKGFDTYEKALEEGLFQALKLLR